MGFSQDWELSYKDNTHLSIWPWTDMVSYVMRYIQPPKSKNFKVLELGCGAGANIPFFQALGVDYYSMDGSASIINQLVKKFPDLNNKLLVGDFTKELPFDIKFDLIVDRAALTHNSETAIKYCLHNIKEQLKNEGKFIGIDWFSDKHSDFQLGQKIQGDQYSRQDFKSGQFIGVGLVHFSNKKHLLKLFKEWDFLIMEEKVIKKQLPVKHVFSSWNFMAQKRSD